MGRKICNSKIGCKEGGLLHQGKTREWSCLPRLQAVQVMLSYLQPNLKSPTHAFCLQYMKKVILVEGKLCLTYIIAINASKKRNPGPT